MDGQAAKSNVWVSFLFTMLSPSREDRSAKSYDATWIVGPMWSTVVSLLGKPLCCDGGKQRVSVLKDEGVASEFL